MSVVVYALCSLLAISQALSGVRGITNEEFFEQLKDFTNDFEVQNRDASGATNYGGSDVIELPGGPDDEIDLLYLLGKIGFRPTKETSGLKPYVSDGASPVKENLLGSCSCQKFNCNCCGSKTFSFHSQSYTLTGCVSIEYLAQSESYLVTVTINGNQVYKKEMTADDPPERCSTYYISGIPGKACLKFYNVDIDNRNACVKLTGSFTLVSTRYETSFGLGCFHIPDQTGLKSAQEMRNEAQDPDRTSAHVLFRHVQYLEIKESSPQKDKTEAAELSAQDDWMPDGSL